MIRIQRIVKQRPKDVLAKAESRFGPAGLGLSVLQKNGTCLELSGGGGYVYVTACPEDKGTDVEISAREWERQAKDFIGSI